MELRHLRYFLTVAETLHFTRAAERLNIGQPPLSQQIQSLERELGVTLFNRTRRSVQLTEAGERLVVRAREILGITGQLGDELGRIAQGETGELRIGFTTTGLFVDELSAPLKQYRQRYPQVRLRLNEMYTDQQIAALKNNEIDIGYVRFSAKKTLSGVTMHLLRCDRLCAVLPDDHPLAHERSLPISALKDASFISYPAGAGAAVPESVRVMCAKAGFTPDVVQEAAEPLTHIGLVAAGIGIAILPQPIDRLKPEGVSFVPLSDEDAGLCMALILRENEASPRVSNFINLAINSAV